MQINAYGQPVGPPVPGWNVRPRPEPILLEGRNVSLEPLAPEHAPELHASVCRPGDEPLWTYRSTEMPATAAQTATFVATTMRSPDALTFALRPTGAGAAGVCSLTRIEPAHGQLEVAAVLFGRSMQRSAAATEAIHLVLRYAFDDLGYRRFEWKCDSLNEPSRRAARRLGFRYEGRFRNHHVLKGRSRDTDWFSITDAEWPAVRAAQERWLDPANFDDTGRQRSSLSALTAGLID